MLKSNELAVASSRVSAITARLLQKSQVRKEKMGGCAEPRDSHPLMSFRGRIAH